MTPILALMALSNFFWAYAIVLTAIWIRAVGRTDRRDHVGHFVNLMGGLIPGIVSVFALLFLGGVLGLPWMIALILLAFPAGIAIGLHLEVGRLIAPDPWHDARRVTITVLLALVLTGYMLEG
jgi:hypothetical protein